MACSAPKNPDAPGPAQTQQAITRILPLFIGFVSWNFPAGVVLYWATSNLFRLGQQVVIFRIDGRPPAPGGTPAKAANPRRAHRPTAQRPRREGTLRCRRRTGRKDRPRSAIAAGGDEVEFVEVKGRTVDVAVEAALAELGLASADKAEIEVLQQPERGFLGLGGREAIVRVRAKKEDASARKRRSRKLQRQRRQPQGKRVEQTNRADREAADQPETRLRRGATRVAGKQVGDERNSESEPRSDAPELAIEEQAKVVEEFLTGLLAAYGLDGTVTTAVDDEIILATVAGDQTEALVGAQGSVMDAVHEVCRTVLQRRSRHAARLRIDIAGYAERRRQALQIYATRLAEQVTEEGARSCSSR